MRHHARIVSLGLLALSTPAFAQGRPQSNCGKFEEARAALGKEFGEVPSFAGMLGTGENALIVFTSAEKRTFTIFVLRPDGIACTVAAGEEFHQLPAMPIPAPAPEEKGS